MLVRVDVDELSTLAKALRTFDVELARATSAASPVFSAGRPNEAISLLTLLAAFSTWALDWADNLEWRVNQVRTADLVAAGFVSSLAFPGSPEDLKEFALREDVAADDWESEYGQWRLEKAQAALARRMEDFFESKRLVDHYHSIGDLEDLVAFVDVFEPHSGEPDLLAAFFDRLGPQETAHIAYLVQNETRGIDRDEAAGMMAVFAQALAVVVAEGRLGDEFVREFINHDGWTLGQFLIHASFDEEFVVDATRTVLSLDERFDELGPMYHFGWEAIGESQESFRPARMALLALAANPGAALRVMDELYRTEWGPDGLDGTWPAEFARALGSALSHDSALRVNRLALGAIVYTTDTGRVTDQTALVLADVYERYVDDFASAAELEVRAPKAHAWAGGIILPKETAWKYLAVLFDHHVAVVPIQDATAQYLAGRASVGATGDDLDWAGDVGALTQLVYDAHAASVTGEARRNDATEAFLHGLLTKAVGVVTLPGGPATKFVKSVAVDQLFKAIDDDYAGAALDEIVEMRQAQLEFETLLVANAYHEAGLTDPDLIAGAIANAERRYPSLEADFVDATGHLLSIDEMNQAQLAALGEWINDQEELWREAATEIARATRAVTVVTQDPNIRVP